MNKQPILKEKKLLVASFLAVIIIYHIVYGLNTLMPSNVSWLMTAMHDWGTHYLGWLFYKGEPWSFPLGNISNYFYPLGTNVGFTDSIPLFALFFKLFSPILPADFQYFGIWLFLCHALTAYFTILFLQLFNINRIIIFIAVIFLVANPVLVFRGLHPALCAHWLIIAPLYLYFLDSRKTNPRKILLHLLLLLLISSLVNPYLCFMVLGFTLIIPLKLCFIDKVISPKTFFFYLGGSLFSLLLCWYLVGMVDFGGKEDFGVTGGFGLYGMNLNSFFNSSGFSSYLPALKQVRPHQYEGYMYLGMGVFLLILVLLCYALYSLIKRSGKQAKLKIWTSANNTNLIPLIFLIAAYTLFSVTHIVTLNDKVLFTAPVPSIILKIGEIFRASGRFFWIPYYIFLFFIIISISKIKTRNFIKISIFALALIIQLLDTKPMLTHWHLTSGTYIPPINNNKWKELIRNCKEVTLYPSFEANNLTSMDYQYFSYFAGNLGKPINTGYVARLDNIAMNKYKDSLKTMLDDGKLNANTLYITTGAHIEDFFTAMASDAIYWNKLDGYYYLLAKNKANSTLTANQPDASEIAKIDSMQRKSGKVQFRKTQKLTHTKTDSIHYSIERIKNKDKYVSADGWAFIENTQNNKGDSLFFSLENDNAFYMAPATIQPRGDVTTYFNRQNLEDAGYRALIFKDSVDKGQYILGLVIKDAKGKQVYQPTDRIIKIKMSDYPIPEKISVQLSASEDIKWSVEYLTLNDSLTKIGGWAYIKDRPATGQIIDLILKKGDVVYSLSTESVPRPDVTEYFKSKYDLSKAGFLVNILNSTLDKGKYQLGIRIRNTARQEEKFVLTDKEVIIP